ncbi:MAG: hypothetical protein WCH11_00895 [Bdellovibrio sp.]
MRFSGAELEGLLLDTTPREHFRNLRGALSNLRLARQTLHPFAVISIALHAGLGLWVQGLGVSFSKERESMLTDSAAPAAALEIRMISTQDHNVDEVFDPLSEIPLKMKRKIPDQKVRLAQLLHQMQALNRDSKHLLSKVAPSEMNTQLLHQALSAGLGSSIAGVVRLNPSRREPWEELQRKLRDQTQSKASDSSDVQKLRSFLVSQKSLFQRCFGHARRADPQLNGSLKTLVSVNSRGVLQNSQFEFSTRSSGTEHLTRCLDQELRALSFPPLSDSTRVQFHLLFAG